MIHVAVIARDTPAARADVWGSDEEKVFSGTTVSARPAVPLRSRLPGPGRPIAGILPGGGATTYRVWLLIADHALEGDWEDGEGTREVLRRLRAAGKIRVLVQRDDESVGELWVRVRTLVGATEQ